MDTESNQTPRGPKSLSQAGWGDDERGDDKEGLAKAAGKEGRGDGQESQASADLGKNASLTGGEIHAQLIRKSISSVQAMWYKRWETTYNRTNENGTK